MSSPVSNRSRPRRPLSAVCLIADDVVVVVVAMLCLWSEDGLPVAGGQFDDRN